MARFQISAFQLARKYSVSSMSKPISLVQIKLTNSSFLACHEVLCLLHVLQGSQEDILDSKEQRLTFSLSKIHWSGYNKAGFKISAFQLARKCSVSSMSSKEARMTFLTPWRSVLLFPLYKSMVWVEIKLDFKFQLSTLPGSAPSPPCPPRKLGGRS